MLSTPITGGNNPERRSLFIGNVTAGTGRIGTPLNCSDAPSARASLSSVLNSMRWALSTQSGSQLGPGLRAQVVNEVW